MKIGDPRVSAIVPAHNEGEAITVVLDRLFELVRLSCGVLVVVDDASDSTVPAVEAYERNEPRIRCLINTYGPGPSNAIRFGIDAAAAPVAVVTMADGCDDARQIDDLVRLVERGVAVAAAWRSRPWTATRAAEPTSPRFRGRQPRASRNIPSTAGSSTPRPGWAT
jgi:dolichol-phosphate mannosyltransferase